MRLIITFVVSLFLLATIQAKAHENEWSMFLLDETTGQILMLSPQGLSEVTNLAWLIDSGVISTPEGHITREFSFSEDFRYVAFPAEIGVQIADIESQSCCVEIAIDTEDSQLAETVLNPDGKAVAIATISGVFSDNPTRGLLSVYDAQTGELIDEIDSEQWNTSDDHHNPNPLELRWNGSNLEFAPSCWACEPNRSSNYWQWNRETGQVSQTDTFGVFWPYDGSILSATNELIYIRFDSDFPINGDYGNVVAYYADPSGFSEDEIPTVAFSNENVEYMESPTWVLDGQAFTIEAKTISRNTYAKLVFRDGEQINIHNYFGNIIGTTDGWLEYNNEGAVLYYTLTEERTLQLTNVWLLPQPFRILMTPQLGSSIDDASFVGVPPFDWGEPLCEGFLPSRLNVGGQGRVTEGAPNNLRAEPNLNAELVGQIPGGDSFTVLDGPACTPGMAWWQVDYRGQIGWTAEGNGNTYWIEHAKTNLCSYCN